MPNGTGLVPPGVKSIINRRDLNPGLTINRIVEPSDWLPDPSTQPARSWVWVLSGGGSKGAFQVGAALKLMRDVRFRPAGIASTSVGSVNALALAEGDDIAVEKLRDIWLALESRNDMYAWSSWVNRADSVLLPHGLSVRKLLASFFGSATTPSLPSPERLMRFSDFERALAGVLAEPVPAVLTSVLSAGIVPLLVLGAVESGTSSLQRAVDEVQRIIERESDGLWTFAPLREKMFRSISLERLDAAAIPIRFVAVGVGDQHLYHAGSDGRVFVMEESPEGNRITTQVGSLSYSDRRDALIAGALASSAIPVVNPAHEWRITDPPRPDRRQAFVDGGVRDILPVDAGLAMFSDELDSTPTPHGVLAIINSASYVDRRDVIFEELNPFPDAEDDDIDDYNMLEVGVRSFGATVDEVLTSERRSVVRGLSEDIDRILITPSISMSSPEPLDPGMNQILLAYGYMTAFDRMRLKLDGLPWELYRERLWQSTNRIMQGRFLCWRIERTGNSYFRMATAGPRAGSYLPRGFALAGNDWIGFLPIELLTGRVTLNCSPDLSWILEGDRLDDSGPRSDGRISLRRLKLLIHNETVSRVREWGLESIPDVHDLSNFEVGNENHVVDWWRRFERHGFNPDNFEPTGPGTFRFDGPTVPGLLHLAGGDTPIVNHFGRPRTDPWESALVWEGSAYNSPLRVVPASPFSNSSFERDPDYGVVRLEGYVLADGFRLPADSESVPLFLAWNNEALDNWTGSGEIPASAFGYERVRDFQGRVFAPTRPRPSGTIPLVTWYSHLRRDHLTTSDFKFLLGNPMVDALPRAEINSGYRDPIVIGYLFSPRNPAPEHTFPLWRWYSPTRRDFFSTTNRAWRFSA